jgi:hypothetical protein
MEVSVQSVQRKRGGREILKISQGHTLEMPKEKISLVKSYHMAILTYGAESWTCPKTDIS